MNPYHLYSASLPIDDEDGWLKRVVPAKLRPWNGRLLTEVEVERAFFAALRQKGLTPDSPGLIAQAAHEWLSEHAW